MGITSKSEHRTNAARRPGVYMHRSFRSVPVSAVNAGLGVAMALLLSLAAYAGREDLARAHQDLVTWFLSAAGVTAELPARQAEIFPGFLQAPVPPVPVPASDDVEEPMRFTAILGALFLLLLSKRNTISRGFFYFLLLLVIAGAAALTALPGMHLNAESLTQMWLRTELPVWLVMPWFAALLFLVMNPDWRAGVAWMMLVMGWIYFSSALREAFVLGVMHFTGLLFFPALWFLFGFLFDLVIVLVAYSVSLHWANAHVWGQRKEMVA